MFNYSFNYFGLFVISLTVGIVTLKSEQSTNKQNI